MTRWRPQIGGFNWLPHRERDAQRARRRCALEWVGASLIGSIAVVGAGVWQGVDRHRADADRAALERDLYAHEAALAEHAEKVREIDASRARLARAAAMSGPSTHLFDLVDALSIAAADGVVIDQLIHRDADSELRASARDDAASSAWLARLNGIRGVHGVDVKDVHRASVTAGAASRPGAPSSRGVTVPATSVSTPPRTEFAATLHWRDVTAQPQRSAK